MKDEPIVVRLTELCADMRLNYEAGECDSRDVPRLCDELETLLKAYKQLKAEFDAYKNASFQ